MRLDRILVIFSIAVAAFTGHAIATSPAMPAVGLGTSEDSFWPADPAGIAVIANHRQIAITDGETTLELGGVAGLRWKDENPSITFAGGDGLLVALQSGYSRKLGYTSEIVAIDLTTGRVRRTPCRCSGLAVLDRQIVTLHSVISNDVERRSFNLRVYDAALTLQSTVPIDVTEPPSEYPGPYVSATVEGTADGEVVISSIWEGDVRRGPSVIALYALDGTLGRRWRVNGSVYSEVAALATGSGGTQFALTVGGSGGACNNHFGPVIISTEAPEPIVLIPDPYQDGHDGLAYGTSDMWWNGEALVTFGSFRGTPPPRRRCTFEHVFRLFDGTGEVVSAETKILQHRLLGSGCDRALLTKIGPHGSSRAYLVENGERRRIKGYDSILWTAPRAETCATLPGLTGT